MVKSTKTDRLREKMRADIRRSKQSTLENLLKPQKAESTKSNEPKQKKQIEITETNTTTKEDELAFTVGFRLIPSRNAFSRITVDLYFDDQKIDSLRLRVLQGPLATDNSEFVSVLAMTGIAQGQHILRVEMYELWSSGEKLTSASKEVNVEYLPLKKEDRLIKIPIVKSVAGADLAIASASEKNIYREIEEDRKKEAASKRDRW
jgi:hypothetical protein